MAMCVEPSEPAFRSLSTRDAYHKEQSMIVSLLLVVLYRLCSKQVLQEDIGLFARGPSSQILWRHAMIDC
jgi:hypothetical protein